MKLQGITRLDVKKLIGGDFSIAESAAMREIILQFEDKYTDTNDIPKDLWNEMKICAIERA